MKSRLMATLGQKEKAKRFVVWCLGVIAQVIGVNLSLNYGSHSGSSEEMGG